MGGGNNEYWNEGMRHAHDGWWGGPLHVILFLLLLALLVAGGVWLFQRFARGGLAPAAAVGSAAGARSGAPDPAVATLRMRYASGEISRDEFQQALADLGGDAGSPAGGGTAPTAS